MISFFTFAFNFKTLPRSLLKLLDNIINYAPLQPSATSIVSCIQGFYAWQRQVVIIVGNDRRHADIVLITPSAESMSSLQMPMSLYFLALHKHSEHKY